MVRLAIFGLLVGVVGGLTSGNGAINVFIGLGAVLPYIVGMLLRVDVDVSEINKRQAVSWMPWIMLISSWLLAINCIWHPYREQLPWRLGYALSEAPAFRGIHSSHEKQTALHLLRQSVLQARVPLDDYDKTLMVIGPQPWMYFALGFRPNTPMIFMHFSGEEIAYKILARRMFRLGLPDYIAVTEDPPAPIRTILAANLTNHYSCFPLELKFTNTLEENAMREYGVTKNMSFCRRTTPST